MVQTSFPCTGPQSRGERQFTILVVEDEFPVRAVLVDCLEEQGCNVLEAANGAAAIQAFLYSEFRIDAVVTDVRMPGAIDGIGVLNWVRENRPGVPVIITSGFCTEQDQRAANDGGCFFAKPYDCDKVATKLIQLLSTS